MSIKIISTNLSDFNKLEDFSKRIDEDFIKDFEQVEYFMSDLRLTTTHYYNDKIDLPRGFIAEGIETTEYQEYKKDTDNNINEIVKYKTEITGMLQDYRLNLIYSNLNSANIKIFIPKKIDF